MQALSCFVLRIGVLSRTAGHPARPGGKAKRKLSAAGTVRVSVEITYTLSGGSANTKTTEVKLKKKS